MLRSFPPHNRSLAAYLCLGLTVQMGWAQAQAPAAAPAAPAPVQNQAPPLPPAAPAPVMPSPIQPGIRILVLQGNHSINNVPNSMVTVPVVEIRDENDRVVEGAKVTFTLPASAGSFETGGAVAEIVTNYQGQAVAPSFKPSQVGAYVIEVTAEFANMKAALKIPQSNSDRLYEPFPKIKKQGGAGLFSGKKKWLLVAGAAAGVGLGIWLSRRNSSNNDIITVVPGGVTVGGPR